MKKNISLIIGLAIPILMILFVAGSIYLPGLFIKPEFDFLYVTGSGYTSTYGEQYTVANGTLIQNKVNPPKDQDYYPPLRPEKLFIYDADKNESLEVSFEEAKLFNLDVNAVSKDGFEIVRGGYDDGIFPLFFGGHSNYNARYLKGHGVSKKLNIPGMKAYDYYDYNFRFLGWIIPSI